MSQSTSTEPAASFQLEQDPTYQKTLKLLEQYKVLRQRSREAEEQFGGGDTDEDFQDDDDDTTGGEGSGSDYHEDEEWQRLLDQPAAAVRSKAELKDHPQRQQSADDDEEDNDDDEQTESIEYRIFVYINTVPIIGAIYGIGRLGGLIWKNVNHSKDKEIKHAKWKIIKNLLTSLTLAAGALLVPLRKREVIAGAIATGFMEGIIDTLVDYYLLSSKERLGTPIEALMFNIMCHTPFLGLFYNLIRLIVFIYHKNIEQIKITLWGLSMNLFTTGLTLFLLIKYSLKATGSIPLSTYNYTRISVFSKSAQEKIALALVEKGATAPLIKVGKTLAAKEGKKLTKRLKRELAQLKLKIDRSVESLSDEHPKIRLRKKLKRLLE